jgi:hypothetical protein
MKRYVTAVFCILWISGCSESTRDWLQGTSHVTCSVSEVLSARVQNLTEQPVDVGACSTDFVVTSPTKTLAAHSPEADELNVQVGSHNVKTEVYLGDSCEEASIARTQTVGNLTPTLSAKNQQASRLCYSPGAQDYPTQLSFYSVVGVQDPCPKGSAPFDPNSVTCKK